MKHPAPLSIVVTNYNYAHYLHQAVDSALAQTYSPVEVVVIDDGSTDGSRAIIEEYDGRVIAVLQPNQGQVAATNAGLHASSGDVVIFLDADDALETDIGAIVMSAFERDAGAVKVQYRLRVVDELGTPTGALHPPGDTPMPSGDLRRHVTVFRAYPSPPTSGNAYRRKFLERVGPVPTDIPNMYPDHYFQHASAMAGRIISIDRIGGIYRIHQANSFASHGVDLNRIRKGITVGEAEHVHLKRFAESLGLTGYPETTIQMLDPHSLTARVVSKKLDPDRHPVPSDELSKLCWHGVRASLAMPGWRARRRFVQAAWFATMLVAPRRVGVWLAERRGQLAARPRRAGIVTRAIARLRASRG